MLQRLARVLRAFAGATRPGAHLKLALAKSLPHNCPPMRLFAGPPPLTHPQPSRRSMNMLQNVTSTLTDMIARGWENFLARPQGTLNFRFILQPTIAAILALRAGINDARNGRPAYLWAAFTKPVYRAQLLHGGWKDIRTPFLVSAVLDAIYQLITHRFIYPLELLFTATLLALVPYLILRGPVNRIVSRFILPDSAAEGADKNAGNRPK